MKYLTKPVIYLDDGDFDESGNLKTLTTDIPVFIMVQALFCGHCTVAKPDFQKIADEYYGRILCATIEGDSKLPEVVSLMKRLDDIYPEFRGFPSYLVYFKDKRMIYNGGRKYKDLKQFLDSNL